MNGSRLTTAFAVLAATFALTACTVSSEERETCEGSGGTVESNSFTIRENASFFDVSESGTLYYCQDLSGAITKVYNDKIEVLSNSWLLADYNEATWKNCDSIGGDTFKTSKKVGNSYSTRYVCVQDGRVVPLKG